jgi:hypothetical protein
MPTTLACMLEAQINLNGPDCEFLFTTPRGRLWRERTFYRDLWKPTQEVSGLDIRPMLSWWPLRLAGSQIYAKPLTSGRTQEGLNRVEL